MLKIYLYSREYLKKHSFSWKIIIPCILIKNYFEFIWPKKFLNYNLIGGCVKEDYANYGIYGATGQGDLSDSPPDGSEDPAFAAQNR